MIAAVESGEIERVIASEVSRLSRSVRDFAATVERIVDENQVALHILDMGIDLDPSEPDPYTSQSPLRSQNSKPRSSVTTYARGSRRVAPRASGTVVRHTDSTSVRRDTSPRTRTMIRRSWSSTNSTKERANASSPAEPASPGRPSGRSTTIASDISRVRPRQPLRDSSTTRTLYADIRKRATRQSNVK